MDAKEAGSWWWPHLRSWRHGLFSVLYRQEAWLHKCFHLLALIISQTVHLFMQKGPCDPGLAVDVLHLLHVPHHLLLIIAHGTFLTCFHSLYQFDLLHFFLPLNYSTKITFRKHFKEEEEKSFVCFKMASSEGTLVDFTCCCCYCWTIPNKV